jgi:hypothetical protein
MNFNQVNLNQGDVNNRVTEVTNTVHNGDVNTATSQSGNVAQGVGTGNNTRVTPPKEGFWTQLWKKIKGLWLGR